MHPPCRRAGLFALALSLALAPGSPAATRLIAEDERGLRLAWTPEPGRSESRLVALPKGQVAVLADSSPGVSIEPGGWRGRQPFARLVLDPAAVGATGGRGVDVAVTFVPGPAPPIAPPEPGHLQRRTEPAPSQPFANADTARRLARATRSVRPDWPRPVAPPPSLLRRRLAAPRPTGGSTGNPGGLGGQRRGPSGEASERPDGFETGRVRLEVAAPRWGVGDRGDGTWRRLDRGGIYRVSWQDLADSGVTVDDVDPARLRLRRETPSGEVVDVALRVLDFGTPGLFDAGDAIEFFGEPLLGEDFIGWYQGADFSDTAVFVLDAADGPQARVAAGPAPLGLPAVADFLEVARFEVDDRFVGRHGVSAFNVDHFYWCPGLTWVSGPAAERSERLELTGLNPGSARTAALRVQLLATTPGDHRSLLELDGLEVSDLQSSGHRVDLHEVADLPAASLGSDVTVTLRLPGPDSLDPDQVELDWIEVAYPRGFTAVDDRLRFELDTAGTVAVDGLSSTADVTVLHLRDDGPPVSLELLSREADAVSFEAPEPGRYAVAAHGGTAGALAPSRIAWMEASDLRDPANAADVLLVAPGPWLHEPDGRLRPTVQAYVDHRAAQGLVVRAASVEEIENEFANGLRTPFALRRLLAQALAEWAVPPTHVVLGGDASVDYKDALAGRVLAPSDCQDIGGGTCGFNEPEWAQHVMTVVWDNPFDTEFLGHYAADAELALAVGPDGIPDVFLGRLPARSAAQLDTMLDAIVGYEEQAASPPPWADAVLLVGDEIDPAIPAEIAIESSQERARADHVEPFYRASTYYFESDYGATDREQFTSDLLSEWSGPGAAVLSYVGHGNALNWSDQSLVTNNRPFEDCRDDIRDALAEPTIPLPVVVNVGCIGGAFMREVGPALLEEMVRSPGGAIAAFGPTGLTDISLANTILDRFFGGIHGRTGRGLRLGEVVFRIQAAFGAAGLFEPLRANALLGDPSLQLVVPHGPAGIDLVAVAGDGLVDLSWTTVPGAEAYNLYREALDPPEGDPTPVATEIAGTAWRDEDVMNGTEYGYWLEPLRAGYPGRWTEPEARARPCDDVAPPPAAGVVADPFFDRLVRLSWTASPGGDVVGYRVRAVPGRDGVGFAAIEQDVIATTTVLGPLEPCREYTFEVRALDACGLVSDPAELATARATPCELAADPPAGVRLGVRREGDDLILEWTEADRTLLGAPLTPTGYVVHGADNPAFLAAAGTELGRPGVRTWTVTGGAVPGAPLEFFGVAAEDDAGRRGPVTRAFPRPVSDLLVEDAGTDWRLSWQAVERDLDGAFTGIRQYEIHASPTPLTRDDVGPATRVGTAVGSTTVFLVDKAEGDFHVVVASDLHGNDSP